MRLSSTPNMRMPDFRICSVLVVDCLIQREAWFLVRPWLAISAYGADWLTIVVSTAMCPRSGVRRPQAHPG